MSSRHRLSLTLLLLALVLALANWPVRAAAVSLHLTMGNPSGAVADVLQPHNYLIERTQYALSYDRDRGIPNWSSWHLGASDLGSATRYSGNFITDTGLPTGWNRVTHNDYTNSGYDRGHMTPSADRTASDGDNQATFLLTNIVPQSPTLNQGLWAIVEGHARDLVGQGNELYIISGGSGTLGTLANGTLTIPAATWKVMLVLPAADGDDVARVTPQTSVIAVWTPNDATTQGKAWTDYTTTVACVQQRTGLNFFAAVEDTVEVAIEGAPCLDSSTYAVYLPLISLAGTVPPVTVTPVTAIPVTATPVTATPVTATPVTVTPVIGGITIPSILYAPTTGATNEYVVIHNGGSSAVDMTGWTLRDAANHVYTFPSFSLTAGADVKVWTKAGTDSATDVYWGSVQAIWNNTGGDTAILQDALGAEVTRYSYL
jgi:endonuclease G, mitochondrial